MAADKNTALIEMIEEKYGKNLHTVELHRSTEKSAFKVLSSLTSINHAKNVKKRSSLISGIKRMVKLRATPDSPPSPNYVSTDFLRHRSIHSSTPPISIGPDTYKTQQFEDNKERYRNLEWDDPPQDSFPIEFCQDTSLHGLKYIGQPKRHISERIFWLLTFLAGLSLAVWLISEMWTKYKQNPVIVSFQPFETNVDQIPFPAITVCNMNKVMRSKVDDYIKRATEGDMEAKIDLYYVDHVCSSTKSFANRFNYKQFEDLQTWQKKNFDFDESVNTANLTQVNQFLRKAAQNCSSMIPLCIWQDRAIDCSQLFRPIETEYGKCCTFNMVPLSLLYTTSNDSRESEEEIKQWQKWNIETDGLLLTSSQEDLKFPRRQMKAGRTNGLSFLLNANSKEYYCTSSDSVGFRMATHFPVEMPKIADFGISLRPKSEIFVDVVPEITMVDPSVFKFTLEQRNCYKEGEYNLNHFKYYSINNCIDECIANETGISCGCKRYYMPRTEKESLCGPQNSDCAQNVKFNKTSIGVRNTCENCKQSCTEIMYEPITTSTKLRTGVWQFENGTKNSDWSEEDLSIVHVYIGQDSFYAKVRKELYGQTDLFANTGGLMGLCLGFSGLSLIEIVYFLTLRAWWKSRRKQVEVININNEEPSADKWITKIQKIPASSPLVPTITNGNELSQTSAESYYQSIFGNVLK